ncbi:AMP-binding protein [Sulfitobacter porphyrae]|uniref:AMP-binding protein n=1 Tax=Sulfitobacter porphyrae TaxID=1246864 RepID=A0ABW2BDQ2_9RHOB
MVYSDPAVTHSETLPQVLLARATSSPNDLAERHKRLGIWREFTWADVLDRVRALALGLENLGLSAGESVMMIGENEPEHFWAEYAVQSLGGKVLSVYPDQNAEEILYLAEDRKRGFFWRRIRSRSINASRSRASIQGPWRSFTGMIPASGAMIILCCIPLKV